VRLGRLKLWWCHRCNVPILDEDRCGTCGEPTAKVNLTPPGDVRPARKVDIERIRRVADEQFGPGAGWALLSDDDQAVVLNKAPAEDRMDEVILDGVVVATMRYDPLSGWRFLPRVEGGDRIAKVASRGLVGLSEDAVPFIEAGKSVLAPGVDSATESIEPGDEVIVVDPQGRAVAVGQTRLTGEEMVALDHGACVKVRHHRRTGDLIPDPGPVEHWDAVIEANRTHMEKMVDKGKAFAIRVADEEGLPVAVSFSGGNDSLATLLIVLEAGMRPPVIFVDTGIELPQTVEHVHEVAERHGLELIVERTEHDFVERSAEFGPPARDYRWCCKTQKLGPVGRALNDRFPGGMLTYIGQRRYESGPRSRSGAKWHNPWVPGQVGASPIQNWTGLHIWLLLMMRGEPSNPWYDLGLERIGCYPCPATDLADLEIVEEHFPGYQRWKEFLQQWAASTGRDQKWVDLFLYRFHKVPKYMTELAGGSTDATVEPPFAISFQRLAPEEEGEARGRFDRELDLARAAELLTILGPTEVEDDAVLVEGGTVKAYKDGTIVAHADDMGATRDLLEKARQLVVKAELCVGCGVCVPRCTSDALAIEDMRVIVHTDECIQCGSCFGPCAVVDFPPVVVDIPVH
jgi:phosphoadenosine phosphosulfate reductase